mmetsp:Transcript_80779/g.234298  ORF Transcript_80779/g.234298 Transcript_80779/m.234298 type:complete len:259 (-) Transcript_80779:557-1333(-)
MSQSPLGSSILCFGMLHGNTESFRMATRAVGPQSSSVPQTAMEGPPSKALSDTTRFKLTRKKRVVDQVSVRKSLTSNEAVDCPGLKRTTVCMPTKSFPASAMKHETGASEVPTSTSTASEHRPKRLMWMVTEPLVSLAEKVCCRKATMSQLRRAGCFDIIRLRILISAGLRLVFACFSMLDQNSSRCMHVHSLITAGGLAAPLTLSTVVKSGESGRNETRTLCVTDLAVSSNFLWTCTTFATKRAPSKVLFKTIVSSM